MKQVSGIWLPDNDKHFADHLHKSEFVGGTATYQLNKYKAALDRVRGRRLALDVGGHVGLWSRAMAHDFDSVIAFEPIEELAECFRRNTAALDHVVLKQMALGDAAGECRLSPLSDNSGHAFIDPSGPFAAQMTTLDAFVEREGIAQIDLLKIDVEGFELQVLQGGEKTIANMRPLIVIEQKPDNAERFGNDRYAARDLLKAWGARLYWKISGDCCMGWKR